MIAITSRLRVVQTQAHLPYYGHCQWFTENKTLKKCRFITGAQTVWNFDFCCFSDPHFFHILSWVSFILLFDPKSSRGTFGVKFWKWGVSRHINIGLQILSDLQKKLIFATTYKFQRALSPQNFEFLPWIKIVYCFHFSIRVLNFKLRTYKSIS